MSIEISGYLMREALVLANFAASGSIGTAAATVDVLSHAVITQTTANVALTLPTPTDLRAGQEFRVTNAGTVLLTVNGLGIGPGLTVNFTWANAAWRNPVATMPERVFRTVLRLPANTATPIVHNLGGATPAIVEVRNDTNGALVTTARVTAETATSVTVINATQVARARVTVIS